MPKLSVIVPVYKAEAVLETCVASVQAQTCSDWELLLIDDGSPDGSGKLCDGYAARDSRVRVFHKSNGGVSSARNLGMDEARGESILFVDADDWIDPEMCRILWEAQTAAGADTVSARATPRAPESSCFSFMRGTSITQRRPGPAGIR